MGVLGGTEGVLVLCGPEIALGILDNLYSGVSNPGGFFACFPSFLRMILGVFRVMIAFFLDCVFVLAFDIV